MSRERRYTDKRPFRSLHPDPRHWTRKGNSYKQKTAYDSEDAAWEFLELNPRLKVEGMVVYQCPECSKWHIGHIKEKYEKRI